MGQTGRIIRRGEVYLVNFDPAVGSEIQKTRPAVVLQINTLNSSSNVTIVAAISSRFREPVSRTKILLQPPEGGVIRPSVVVTNQIRSIDRARLTMFLGRLEP